MNCLVVIDVQNDFVTGSLGTPEAVECSRACWKRCAALKEPF